MSPTGSLAGCFAGLPCLLTVSFFTVAVLRQCHVGAPTLLLPGHAAAVCAGVRRLHQSGEFRDTVTQAGSCGWKQDRILRNAAASQGKEKNQELSEADVSFLMPHLVAAPYLKKGDKQRLDVTSLPPLLGPPEPVCSKASPEPTGIYGQFVNRPKCIRCT